MRYLWLVVVLVVCACPTVPIRREVCTRYVGCSLLVDPASGKDVERTYGTSAACWVDDRQARACVEACSAGIKSLQSNGFCGTEQP